ncbi:MAG: putative DNA binding domain-containing protein [Anaerolineae bacterium]|nr:putative DNA binding domain-containing protein [Anaerolineae bacterium]
METTDLQSIYDQGQSETLAFESESAPILRFAETFSALANSEGGLVLVGIDPVTEAIKGLKDVETAREKTLAAGLRCEPPLVLPRPVVAILQGKPVLIASIPSGLPHAYALRGKYLEREGKKNRALGPRQLRDLLRQRGEGNFEAQVLQGATLDELDRERVDAYAKLFLTDVSSRSRWDEGTLDLLYRRGCLAKESGAYRPTVAGLLLFGREPQRLLPSAEIVLVRYSGAEMSDTFIRETARGSLSEQVRAAEAFLVANMRKGARITELRRQEKPEYPLPAVREVIVNAVAHRDYQIRGEEIRVLMFVDRVEVYSPGRLPGHITIENIVQERFARNEVIVQVLTDLGFVERLGYGIDRILRQMNEAGLPKPRFQETANGFRVTLRGAGDQFVTTDFDRTRYHNLPLNERQTAALQILHKTGRIGNRDLKEAYPDVSEETIRRDLADLVDAGLLIKMGDRRGTYYILK